MWHGERQALGAGAPRATRWGGSWWSAWRRQGPRRAPGHSVRLLLGVLAKPAISIPRTREVGACWPAARWTACEDGGQAAGLAGGRCVGRPAGVRDAWGETPARCDSGGALHPPGNRPAAVAHLAGALAPYAAAPERSASGRAPWARWERAPRPAPHCARQAARRGRRAQPRGASRASARRKAAGWGRRLYTSSPGCARGSPHPDGRAGNGRGVAGPRPRARSPWG